MKQTLFYNQHRNLGAVMVPFAGFEMPIHYPLGIIKEHEWVRTRAGLFDVSHMRQARLEGPTATKTLEHITPTAFENISNGQAKYTVLLNETGGIVDDCIIIKIEQNIFHLVLNASRAEEDINWINTHLKEGSTFRPLPESAPLLALQGPHAQEVLESLLPNASPLKSLGFMQGFFTQLMGAEVLVTRTGYTGEDGFELSINANPETAEHIWLALLQHDSVKPIGLGARDSLRLEAGFPLYGQDLDETTSPVEASISWIIRKDNTSFLGAERIKKEQTEGIRRKRIGVLLTERGIARTGAPIFSADGKKIGTLTSGSVCPTTRQAIGQGYIDPTYIKPGEIILLEVRKRRLRGQIHGLSFIGAQTPKPSA